ncbi:MAG: hypothetical protein M1358_03350 [Chloroflexi bacterium]|nr:hypothetical protein [Chloroflexota bacterium]
MKILKLIGAGLVILLSVVGLVVCVGVIVGTWVFVPQAKDTVTKTFAPVEDHLNSADNDLTRVNTTIERARNDLKAIDQAAATVGDRISGGSPVLGAITSTVNGSLSPEIKDLVRTLDTVQEVSIALNTSLEVIDAFPGISVPKPALTVTKVVSDSLTDLAASTEELKTRLQDIGQGKQDGLASAVTGITSRIDAQLERVQSFVTDIQSSVRRIEARILELKSEILMWIDRVAILVSLVLLWVGASQVSVFAHGWSFFSRVR